MRNNTKTRKAKTMQTKFQRVWNPIEDPCEGEVIINTIGELFDVDELVEEGPFLVDLLLPVGVNPYDAYYTGDETGRMGDYDVRFKFHKIYNGGIYRVVSYEVEITKVEAYI